jgi:hypothetical protein
LAGTRVGLARCQGGDDVGMDSLHLGLALLAVAAAVLLSAVSAVALVANRWDRFLVDRLILAVLAALALASAAGVAIAFTAGPPADVLHLVYSGLAFAALPVARYLGRSGTPRRRAAIAATGALLLLAFLARLFMTGAPS